jgi:hypothetical protein
MAPDFDAAKVQRMKRHETSQMRNSGVVAVALAAAYARCGKYGRNALPILVLAASGTLAATAAMWQSVTADELGIVPNGVALLKTGGFDIDALAPPLGKMLYAIPLLPANVTFETSWCDGRSSWTLGDRFVIGNRERFHALFCISSDGGSRGHAGHGLGGEVVRMPALW